MLWNSLLTFFFSAGFMIAAVVYLAKLIIEKLADSKLGKYKNGLQKDADDFKHRLNLMATEHQIRYAKLYEERGQVIKEIYKLLLDLEKSLCELTSKFQGPGWFEVHSEKDKKVMSDINSLRDFLELNRIFFSEPLCKKVEWILEKAFKIATEMHFAKRKETIVNHKVKRNLPVTKEELLEPMEKWTELEERVQDEIKSARYELARDFRKLIGVE